MILNGWHGKLVDSMLEGFSSTFDIRHPPQKKLFGGFTSFGGEFSHTWRWKLHLLFETDARVVTMNTNGRLAELLYFITRAPSRKTRGFHDGDNTFCVYLGYDNILWSDSWVLTFIFCSFETSVPSRLQKRVIIPKIATEMVHHAHIRQL